MKSYPHNFLFGELLQIKGRASSMPAEEVESGEGGEGGRLRPCHVPQMEVTGFRIVDVATGQANERNGKISNSDAGERTCSSWIKVLTGEFIIDRTLTESCHYTLLDKPWSFRFSLPCFPSSLPHKADLAYPQWPLPQTGTPQRIQARLRKPPRTATEKLFSLFLGHYSALLPPFN